MGLSDISKDKYWVHAFSLVYGKEALLPLEVEIPAVKMLEKMMRQPQNAFYGEVVASAEGPTG